MIHYRKCKGLDRTPIVEAIKKVIKEKLIIRSRLLNENSKSYKSSPVRELLSQHKVDKLKRYPIKFNEHLLNKMKLEEKNRGIQQNYVAMVRQAIRKEEIEKKAYKIKQLKQILMNSV